MSDKVFHQPDETAMHKLLSKYEYDVAGIVLRLAWCAGLSRKEISELTWEQVDFEDKLLHLPDRDVPLENELAEALQHWRSLFGTKNCPTYVVISLAKKSRYAPQHLSRIARSALDMADMKNVRLIDLRHDFVRRMMEQYDWHYAIRVSGLTVTTYRANYIGRRQQSHPSVPTLLSEGDKASHTQELLKKNRDNAAGIALWLSQYGNLKEKEIVELTWDQIDFAKGTVRIDRGEFAMSEEVIAVLNEEMGRRNPSDDPHVILTQRSRKPMDTARLSNLIQTLLVHNGLESIGIDDLRYSNHIRQQREHILQHAKVAGLVTRREVEAMLGVKPNVAYSRLIELVENGDLVRTSRGYLPTERAVPPEKRGEFILRYIVENGAVTPTEIAEQLYIGKRTASRLLQRMVKTGELVMIRKDEKYFLPEK